MPHTGTGTIASSAARDRPTREPAAVSTPLDPALAEGARNCARFGNVRAGEEVAIVSEPGVDEAVVDALAVAMKDAGARVSILIKEATGQAQALSAVHAAVLRAADAVFELGVPSAHTEAGFLAGFDYGTRQLALRPNRQVLASQAAQFPVEIFYELGRRAQRLLRSERQIHVGDDRGTDLAMVIEPGSVGGYIGPVPYEPGPAVPGYLGSFPPGSCVWGDVNYSITGRVVLDAVYEFTAPREVVVCEIDKGWITSIHGGAEAEAIAELVFSTKNAAPRRRMRIRPEPEGSAVGPRTRRGSARDPRVLDPARRHLLPGDGRRHAPGRQGRQRDEPHLWLPARAHGDSWRHRADERRQDRVVGQSRPPAAGARREGRRAAVASDWRGSVSLQSDADRFFAALNAAVSGAPMAAFPIDLLLSTPTESARLSFRGGTAVVATEQDPLWTLELRGDRDAFGSLFSGRRTLGASLYAGVIVAPEEKAKHNLAVALACSIRLLQDGCSAISLAASSSD